jgi:monoamine oxidase
VKLYQTPSSVMTTTTTTTTTTATTTIIIGAGIAGLSAGHHLLKNAEKHRSIVLLEGRDRIGGRVWTNRTVSGGDVPVEFGAESIHGGPEVNTIWAWVQKLGLRTLHWQTCVDSMIRMDDGRWLTVMEARRASPEFDQTRSWEMKDGAPEALSDEDLGTYLKRCGFNAEQLRYVQRTFANSEGDSMDVLNAKAHANLFCDRDSHDGYGDFRILDGYDSVYNALAEGLDIRLNMKVTAVDWSDNNTVTVTTADGQLWTADSAIVTLPVGVLQANKVAFTPPLPPTKQEALRGLKMGPVMKMIYEFDAPITDDSTSAIFAKGNPPMWWSPSVGQESTAVIWVAFFSGDYAREMLALGEPAALQKGLETLRDEVGKPDLAFRQARWINWPEDEFALGGYSVCLPGHYDAREALAQPTPPLYWAGEATAPHHLTAMVHGAYFTGERAAREVLLRCSSCGSSLDITTSDGFETL